MPLSPYQNEAQLHSRIVSNITRLLFIKNDILFKPIHGSQCQHAASLVLILRGILHQMRLTVNEFR